VPGANKGGRRT